MVSDSDSQPTDRETTVEKIQARAPDGWVGLEEDAASSTIAYFCGGFESETTSGKAQLGDRVHAWRGIEQDDGSIRIVGHQHDEVPEDAQYAVEVIQDGAAGVVCEAFATDQEDLLETVVAAAIGLEQYGEDFSAEHIKQIDVEDPED